MSWSRYSVSTIYRRGEVPCEETVRLKLMLDKTRAVQRIGLREVSVDDFISSDHTEEHSAFHHTFYGIPEHE